MSLFQNQIGLESFIAVIWDQEGGKCWFSGIILRWPTLAPQSIGWSGLPPLTRWSIEHSIDNCKLLRQKTWTKIIWEILKLKIYQKTNQGQESRLRARSLAESSEGGSTGERPSSQESSSSPKPPLSSSSAASSSPSWSSLGDLGGSQGSGLQDLGQVNRGS